MGSIPVGGAISKKVSALVVGAFFDNNSRVEKSLRKRSEAELGSQHCSVVFVSKTNEGWNKFPLGVPSKIRFRKKADFVLFIFHYSIFIIH